MQGFTVERISGKAAREFIRANHYTGTCHNGPLGWGLFRYGALVGVCAFAPPCSEAVRESVFGPEHKKRVMELHRLYTPDRGPDNLTSWFVARVLRSLREERPYLRGILSYADATEGHTGTVYQALNALYLGMTNKEKFFRGEDGKLHHKRQNGKTLTNVEASKRGWLPEYRQAKYRYLFIIGSKLQRKKWRKCLLLPQEKYPKA